MSELDNITVTLTNDDYWRIRHALVIASQHHQKAVDRITGQNQRSTDTILQHEHILRRLWDVEEVLKLAAINATLQAETQEDDVNYEPNPGDHIMVTTQHPYKVIRAVFDGYVEREGTQGSGRYIALASASTAAKIDVPMSNVLSIEPHTGPETND